MNEARLPRPVARLRATTKFDPEIKHAQVGRLYVRQARLATQSATNHHAAKMAAKLDRRIRSLAYAP